MKKNRYLIEVDGKIYPSVGHAAKATGIKRTTLNEKIKEFEVENLTTYSVTYASKVFTITKFN